MAGAVASGTAPGSLRALLRRPLLVGVAALCLVTALAVAMTALLLAGLSPRVDAADEMLSVVQDGHVAMVNQETGLRGFLITRDQRFLEPYWQGADDLRRLDIRLSGLARRAGELASGVRLLREAEDQWISAWALPLLRVQPEVGDRDALSSLLLRGKQLFDAYRQVELRVRSEVEARRNAAVGWQRVALIAGVLVDLAAGVVVAAAVRRANRRLARQILPPTVELRATLNTLTGGNLARRAEVAGPAELRAIAADVNRLGAALERRGREVAQRERELQEAHAAALAAGHAKTAFLAMMSHEIRTPLNAVLGLADLLLTTDLSAEQRAYLDTIASSGDSLLMLINDVLDFSKIEAGQLDLASAPFDAVDLVYDVAGLFAGQAAGKGVDLLVEVDEEGPRELVGDAARLRQILVNLVGNAIKFTSTGEVLIGLRTDGSGFEPDLVRCEIRVCDTGIGITAQGQSRLFRSFSQVDDSTAGRDLPVLLLSSGTMPAEAAREFAARLHKPTRPEQLLKAVAAAVANVPAPRSSRAHNRAADAQSGAERRLRVLVAEDHPINQQLMRSYLHQLGHDVELVSDGRSAVDAVASTSFDVVLMDGQMPVLSGLDATTAIRALPGRRPRIIAVTASAFADDRAAFLAAGADDFLAKPVRLAVLADALAHISAELSSTGSTAPAEPPPPAAPRQHSTR